MSIAPKRVILKGPYVAKSGYEFVRVLEVDTNRKYLMPYHRYVWETAHGERIPPNYIIHHKDKKKRNNDISNLQLMTRAAHRKLHNELRAKKRMAKRIIRANRKLARRK